MVRPTLIAQEPAREPLYVEAAKKKAHGAGKITCGILKQMSKNLDEYISFCERWENGEGALHRKKDRFLAIQREDAIPTIPALSDAWRNRPVGCESSHKALLSRVTAFRTARDNLETDPNIKMLPTKEKEATLIVHRTKYNEKIKSIQIALLKMRRAKANSMMPTEFPHAFGFIRQLEATSKLREIERRLGGKMDVEEKEKRFPCLRRGWPDKLVKKEKEKAESACDSEDGEDQEEDGSGAGSATEEQEPEPEQEEAHEELVLTAEEEAALDPNEPTDFLVAEDDESFADRRFDEASTAPRFERAAASRGEASSSSAKGGGGQGAAFESIFGNECDEEEEEQQQQEQEQYSEDDEESGE